MGGHRTRKVRTLAPGPEGTEKTQDDEEKRDRRFGGCVSVLSVRVTASEICGRPQNREAVTGCEDK